MKTAVVVKPAKKKSDKLPESVSPEHMGLLLDFKQNVSGWASTEMSILKVE